MDHKIKELKIYFNNYKRYKKISEDKEQTFYKRNKNKLLADNLLKEIDNLLKEIE